MTTSPLRIWQPSTTLPTTGVQVGDLCTRTGDPAGMYWWDGGKWLPLNAPVPVPPPPPLPPPPAPRPLDPETVAGSTPVGTATYQPAAGALYVSPTGSDGNTGAVTLPLATFEKACQLVRPGGMIVLRAGTYHEGRRGTASTYAGIYLTTPNVTVQAYPGEAVWFDGSVVVAGWTATGGRWQAPWLTLLDRSPTFDFGAPESTTPGWQFVNPNYPAAAWPDMLFIDGVQQTQVTTLAGVAAGKFFVDQGAGMVYLGSDPTGREVRMSELSTCLSLGAGCTLQGVGVRRYAPSMPHLGALKGLGAGATFRDVWVEDIATIGISQQAAPNQVLRNVTVLRAGCLGVHANQADNLTHDRVWVQFGNREHFNYSPAAGNVKVTRSRGYTIRESVVSDSFGRGLWTDEQVVGVNVVTCNIQRNEDQGEMFELSGDVLTVNCLVTNNGASGVSLMNTSRTRILNNTITDNGALRGKTFDNSSPRQVAIYLDERAPLRAGSGAVDPRYGYPDPAGVNWELQSVVMYSNVNAGGNVQAMVGVEDYRKNGGTARRWQDEGLDWRGNLYGRPSAWLGFLPNAGAANVSVYPALADMRTATGLEVGSTEIPGTPTASQLAVADASAMPLDAAVAKLIGQPAGVRHAGCWR